MDEDKLPFVISYSKPFAAKIKEFFGANRRFFQKFCENANRNGTKAEKGIRHVHPKIPKGAQRRTEQAKIERPAQQRAQHQIKPQLPLRRAQGKTDQPRRHAQAEHPVAEYQKVRIAPPHRAQKVIGKSQTAAQQRRAQKEQKLRRNIILHPQPNSRESRLPRSRRSSS